MSAFIIATLIVHGLLIVAGTSAVLRRGEIDGSDVLLPSVFISLAVWAGILLFQ